MEARTYLITGVSSDLGKTFLKQLVQKDEPALCIAIYRTWHDSLAQIAKEASALKIRFEQCDLADAPQVNSLLTAWQAEQIVPTHIVHFAASLFQYMRFRQLDIEAMQKDMQIQVYSFAAILKAFLPLMAKKHFGRVVAMVSNCTIGVPPKCLANYTTVKYALLGLLRSAASEYGASGITVNGVSPGMIETKFLKGIDEKIVELDAASSPLKRHITPAEVVAGINFLLDDANVFSNGVNLNLSAGNPM